MRYIWTILIILTIVLVFTIPAMILTFSFDEPIEASNGAVKSILNYIFKD